MKGHGLIALFLAVVLSGCVGRSAVAPLAPGASNTVAAVEGTENAVQKTQIALLLPLSGPQSGMGRSVRDGFLSAYYEQGGQHTTVQMYDTGGTAEKTRE